MYNEIEISTRSIIVFHPFYSSPPAKIFNVPLMLGPQIMLASLTREYTIKLRWFAICSINPIILYDLHGFVIFALYTVFLFLPSPMMVPSHHREQTLN